MTKLLIEKGARINVINHEYWGRTPLFTAAEYGNSSKTMERFTQRSFELIVKIHSNSRVIRFIQKQQQQ